MEKAIATSTKVPAGWVVCHKHKEAFCVYNKRENSQCPFCVAQFIINPNLKNESPIKNSQVNAQQDAGELVEQETTS
jgi:hypothetical protein